MAGGWEGGAFKSQVFHPAPYLPTHATPSKGARIVSKAFGGQLGLVTF